MAIKLFNRFRDFLYYSECAVCKIRLESSDRLPLCPVCREKWTYERNNADNAQKFIPKAPLDSLCHLSFYKRDDDSIARDLILSQKEFDSPAVNKFLASELSDMLKSQLPDIGDDTVVCSVPRSNVNLTEKGFNQAESLGRCIADKLSLSYVNALRYIGTNIIQHGLSPKERWENASLSYAINEYAIKEVACRRIILVDDVYTTGATLSSCASILKKFGARSVNGAVIARSYSYLFDGMTGNENPNEPKFY